MRAEDGLASGRACDCPRCGYDLRGVIGSWRTECPLRGTCSECGLVYAWGDAFSDRLAGPRWSFEHGSRLSVTRFLSTLVRVTGMPRTWSRLRMGHPIFVGRLTVYGVVAYALFHGAVAAPVLGEDLVWFWTSWRAGDLAWAAMATKHALWPYVEDNPLFWDGLSGIYLLWGLVHWGVFPAMMLVMEETMRRVKVRRRHLVRGVAYSMVPIGAATPRRLSGGGRRVERPNPRLVQSARSRR